MPAWIATISNQRSKPGRCSIGFPPLQARLWQGSQNCRNGRKAKKTRGLLPVCSGDLPSIGLIKRAMDQALAIRAERAPFDVLEPYRQSLPLVLASPHSGAEYPADFVARSRLDLRTLRRSEDSFVDELFIGAIDLGAPLLRACFPRALIDPNREPFELDPSMFDGPLPDYVNTASPRVAAGLGTIARVVASGDAIYRGKLSFAEACRRVECYYRPYHQALRELLDRTKRQFGYAVLIDCHSMPSIGGPMEGDSGRGRVDFVLGDHHGRACNRGLIDCAEMEMRRMGYRVDRNSPYSGGFTTQHYGRPEANVHVLQIEINRAIYMDERAYRKAPGFAKVQDDLHKFVGALAQVRLDEPTKVKSEPRP